MSTRAPGPPSFTACAALRRGDVIEFALRDRSRIRFVVDSARAVPRTCFPTRQVYAPTRKPTLRLVTCDGAFDTSTGHYLDNYIVFASIAARRP